MDNEPRIVVLISGSGTNLQAIFDAIVQGNLDARVAAVVSNRKSAFGLIRAQDAGVSTLYFPLKPYLGTNRTRLDYDQELAQEVLKYAPDLVVLAGWMHVLSDTFLKCFPDKVINLHPALPGMFAGTDAIRRAFEAYSQGDIRETGCMVHYVIPEVDAGRVIAESKVPIYPDDTLQSLEERMHQAEHILIVQAIQKVLSSGTC